MTPAELLTEASRVATSLVEDALDDDRTSLPFAEVFQAAEELGVHVSTLIGMVRAYGMAVEERTIPRAVRGFTSNPHDRWYGPGACKTHGGSGWEQIAGFAGQEG